jgi:molybdenum cofactor cytidylyltransferase
MGAHVLRLAEDTPDMRATCEYGLAWIEEHFHPDNHDGWLLLPADHPTVRLHVICSILCVAEEFGDVIGIAGKSIIVPTHQGRRGHPTWLRWSHAAAIRALPEDQGLNTFIREHADETYELPWMTDEILRDLDTPADFEALIKGCYP